MQYYSKIRRVEETEDGTYIILQLPGVKIKDKLIRYKNSSAIDSELFINDKRRLSAEQRMKIWATIGDIANSLGYTSKNFLKTRLVEEFCYIKDIPIFSVSERNEDAASVTIAREFISYIIEIGILLDVQFKDSPIVRTEDIDRWLYFCVANRICCITGRKGADIHHVTGSRVGMGRSRVSISHSGLEIMGLSREWHNKVHYEGEVDIFEKYKIYGIAVDDETLHSLGIKYDDIS